MAETLSQFTPAGDKEDFSPTGVKAWTAAVSEMIEASRAGKPEVFDFDAPRSQFFNPLTTPIAADQKEKGIFWFAFPKTLRFEHGSVGTARWEAADGSRDLQDEYCEWAVHKEGGKIRRVVFTTETPEYWETLAQQSKDRLLGLYSDFIGRPVDESEVFDGPANYEPRNALNNSTEHGPVHLIQGTNFLSAAVELAAAATIMRQAPDGRLITSEQELIGCSKYGESKRNSDPHIGAQVNELARMKADITIADPPGLFLAGLSTAGWTTPDGADPQSFWKPLRGVKGRRVRAVYEVPASKGYTVSEIKIRRRPIEFGAQIADFVSVKIVGLACRFSQSIAEPMTECRRTRSRSG
jgi:hypothetical protein